MFLAVTDLFGVAAIIAALFSGIAGLLGALNRTAVKETQRTAQDVQQKVHETAKDLEAHYHRVESAYQANAVASTALLGFLERKEGKDVERQQPTGAKRRSVQRGSSASKSRRS